MKTLRPKLVWILPLLIITAGILLLFYENYQEVTEPADQDWSRDWEIGETTAVKQPHIQKTDDGIQISYLTESGITRHTYDNDYTEKDVQQYAIPVDTFTSFYLENDALLYSDYYSLYRGDTEEKIMDIDGFIPMSTAALYQKGDTLYAIDPSNYESSELMTLASIDSTVKTAETEEGAYLMEEYTDGEGRQLHFYEHLDDQVKKIGEATFLPSGSESIKDIQFTMQGNEASVLISTVQKQSASGQMENHYYYGTTTFQNALKTTRLSFTDPVSAQPLREVSDMSLHPQKDGASLLFKAVGATNTRLGESSQFNIYKAHLGTSGVGEVTRISNTPDLSTHPVQTNDGSVVWVDKGGDSHKLLLSSQNPEIIEKADTWNTRVLLGALGKTMGMLSYSFFGLLIMTFWYIWPLLFLVILLFVKRDALDQDRTWILLSGIAIYLAAAIIVRSPLFSEKLLARAPDYLSFPGSPIIFILGFALIAFGIMKTGAKLRDWSIPIQITYFIGVHVALITIFFGPYVL
ncbi:hypothetical protein GLW04_14570 [Halobacillus litoralis]|uniref:Uncharacterized protein n=1 Tax=Halobacillus litoralis TaxID=45668 RepID=A0A845DXD6_9BACI|nr:hypothetical protein [Halobacillus litoralis]MYL21125.1 hypothetical protein [Halobacillus litoralis]MYL38506.1 hypothetical protein [Halobacillus litoralis]